MQVVLRAELSVLKHFISNLGGLTINVKFLCQMRHYDLFGIEWVLRGGKCWFYGGSL